MSNLLSNLYTPSLLRANCVMDFFLESLQNLEMDIAGELQTMLKTAKVTSTVELNENSLMKLSKNSLTDIAIRLAKLYEKNLNT